jgi:uncharacterized protein (DUF1778 family)
MRVTPEEDELLRAAAESAHLSMSAFILNAAAQAAEAQLSRARFYTISSERFDAFLTELDQPVTSNPAMVELFRRAAK